MKKICIGLFGILACSTSLHADGFSESDRSLIGDKEIFPPDDEGMLPEARAAYGLGAESAYFDPKNSEEMEKRAPEVQNDDD